jgi:ABC-type sulfate/molybdate transport systems ATPase subunit
VGDTPFFDAARSINVPLNRRNIGMVFQSYAIWPHMTVMENVSFPLRVAKDRRYSRDEIDRMSRKALATVDLEGFADRSATRLSGGQQQRVALARAIVREPKLLLLDEPTSALDPVGRRTVRLLLEELRGRGVSVLLNSHLLSEIELVCDRVVILLGGDVVTAGAPHELARPRGVELETDAGVQTIAGATREDAPRLVAEAVAAGRRVYGVRVLTSTLEEVYLEAVGGETD